MLKNYGAVTCWSEQLIKCPEFSRTPNLESLSLPGCTSLSGISSSIQHLTKLESLDIRSCISLTSIPDLPNSLNGWIQLYYLTSLVEIPSSFIHLNEVTLLYIGACKSLVSIPDLRGWKSLKKLMIDKCWKLKVLPDVPNNIERLDLTNIPIEELPPSFGDLCRLKHLNLSGCSMLKSLPRSICKWKSLQWLILLNCSRIDKLPDDIGTLESLKEINGRGTAIREVPPSISCLRRHCLGSLSFSRCEILSSLLGLDNLLCLDLSDSGMTKIPTTLICLTSLSQLYLDRNNFVIIPESIIRLSDLELLSISHCERLKVLPKLPWTSINANNCTSLEKLSCLPFQNDTFEFGSQTMVANFINCFKLDRNSINVFVENVRRKIQDVAAFNIRYHEQVNQRAKLPASICYPESEIPEWFDIRSNGSSINVKLPPHWINCNFVCFALSAVVAITNSDVLFECEVKSRDGDRNVVWTTDSYFSVSDPDHGPDYIRSSHVIIGLGFHFLPEICDTEFSFQFIVKNYEGHKVEKCGVHFMLAKYLEPQPKRFETNRIHPGEKHN